MPVEYRIDPNQSMTELYQAKPLDMGYAQEAVKYGVEADRQARMAKQKAADARDADLQTNLAKIGQMKIMPRDQGLFAEKATGIYDYVKKNQEALRSGDAKAIMGFQQLYGDYTQKAKISEDTQNKYMELGAQLAKDPEAVIPESTEYWKNFGSSQAAGQWDLDPTQIVQKVNTFERVQKLSDFAKKRADETQTPYRETFDKPQAEKLLEDDYLSDPALMRQVVSDFNHTEDKLGSTDPLDWYKKKNADYLVQNIRKAPPQYMFESATKPGTTITQTVTDNGGEIHVMDPKTNEEVTVQYDDKGNVTGGVRGTRLTPEEKTQNDLVNRENQDKREAYNSAMKKAELYRASLGTNPTKDELLKLAALIPKKNFSQYKEKPLPHKEKSISLNAQQAQEVSYDKFKVKPKDIIQGKQPAGVGVQKIENKKPTLTKAALEAKAKAAGYTYDEYYQLVKDKITLQ